jgi:23S rRNA G2445 N2-methylase RlmL
MSRRSAPSLPACFATVIPGLEAVASAEIEQKLKADIKRKAEGIVVFRVAEIDRRLLELRTVEDVFVLAWGTDDLARRFSDLKQIQTWTARHVDWGNLLAIHHAVHAKPKGKPTYRLVAQMEGQHPYRRVDAREALAKGLAGKLPASWKHAEENASVEVWLRITGGTAVCGLRLSDRTMRHRHYKREHIAASLRPTLAAAMVQLAEIQPDQVVLDPCCGAGTILAEYLATARRAGCVLGGDIDVKALRAAQANLRRLGQACLVRWDARQLPIGDSLIDRIVCNPPFGKQLGRAQEISPLYEQLVSECARVLRSRSPAVFLVGDYRPLQAAAQAVSWKREQQFRVRILGQPATVVVYRSP